MKFGLKERGAVFGFHSSQLPIPCPALSNKEGHINLSKFRSLQKDLTSLTKPKDKILSHLIDKESLCSVLQRPTCNHLRSYYQLVGPTFLEKIIPEQ